MNNTIKIQFDAIANEWDKNSGEKGLFHQRNDIDPKIIKVFGKISGKKILEIGCGNGYLSRLLANKGSIITATDISPKLIKLAKGKTNNNSKIKYLVQDAQNMHDLKSNSFDMVLANMCVMDIPNIQLAFSEIKRVLKKKGVFIFSLNHPAFYNYGQSWTYSDIEGSKYFSRLVPKYLSNGEDKIIFKFDTEKKTEIVNIHRPIEYYLKILFNNNFVVTNFLELNTIEKPQKANKEDGEVVLRKSRFTSLEDKILKEKATKEIPMFLIIEAKLL